jgi:hypothetical protein
MNRKMLFLLGLVFFVAAGASAANTFTNSGGYWDVPGNWDLGHVPTNGEDAVINANVTLTNSTANLGVYTLNSGKTNTFGGTNTILTASNVVINGTITHNPQTDVTGTPGVYGDWTMDHRVWIVCTDLFVTASGRINADSKGYQGALNVNGRGPGAYNGIDGAAYGGQAGQGLASTYGSAGMPFDCGSAGSYYFGNTAGGHGGGAVRVEAAGRAVVNGQITANGGRGVSSLTGGGSGGGIYLVCGTFDGTNGAIRADGGSPSGGYGGGGGRIAIHYDTSAQAGTFPTVELSADGATGSTSTGYVGTIWLPDGQILPTAFSPTSLINGVIWGVMNWSPTSLTVNNGLLALAEPGFNLRVTNDLIVSGSTGVLHVADAASIWCGGRLMVTNGGRTYIASTSTNGALPDDYGLLLDIGGDLMVTTNSALYLSCHPTNGASPLLRAANVTVAAGGLLSAQAALYLNTTVAGRLRLRTGGYAGGGVQQNGVGPGGGKSVPVFSQYRVGGGGGYGGLGGQCRDYSSYGPYGTNYGQSVSNAPILPGSGGHGGIAGNGGYGGGVVRIEASVVTLDGTLTANGQGGGSSQAGGAGSGGSVYLNCDRLSGGGAISARGGVGVNTANEATGGGGGGRIAVRTPNTNTWSGSLSYAAGSVSGGSNATYPVCAGTTGTIVWTILDVPIISNGSGATNVHSTYASLNGYLSKTGSSAAAVWVYWGQIDGEKDKAIWPTNALVNAAQPLGAATWLTSDTEPLSPGVTYYYRYYASNTAGGAWAETSEDFITGDVWIEATQPNAAETGPTNGVFTACRSPGATNEDLVVYYSVSGSASNGVDYNVGTPLPGNVTIPAGASNVTVTIMPYQDGDDAEGLESVTLTLSPGHYAVGAPQSNTVFIADMPVPAQNVWTGGNGNWTNPVQWSAGFAPVQRQHILIPAGSTVTLSTAATVLGALGSLTNNGALVCDTLGAVVNADEIILNGLLTHNPQTDVSGTPGVYADWSMDNRVHVVCSNLTVTATGRLNADAKGYQGATGALGRGPGGPGAADAGGSHGGGGSAVGTPASPYGSVATPFDPGSAGSYSHGGTAGGHGGGAIRIEALGTVTVNGQITAKGGPGVSGQTGGGSGGGIYVLCRTLSGTTGAIRADGGTPSSGRGGGGGRIAMHYDSVAQALVPVPSIKIAADGAVGSTGAGDYGSIWLPDARLLAGVVTTNTLVFGRLWGVTNWTSDAITISNAYLQLNETALNVTVTNALQVMGSNAVLDLRQPALLSCGSAAVSNGGRLYFRSAPTNAASTNAVGGILSVTGDLTVGSNAWLYLQCQSSNGAIPRVMAANVSVGLFGTVSADGAGYAGGLLYEPGLGLGGGPRAGRGGAGGACGGGGGCGYDFGYSPATPPASLPYGQASSNAPTLPGSGGGAGDKPGAAGGGVIWIQTGSLVVDGLLTADGATPGAGTYGSGGGAGGSIYLDCDRLGGGGTIRAKGGKGYYVNSNGAGGGGGGGRIAVRSVGKRNWSGSLSYADGSVTGGVTHATFSPKCDGGEGTIVWIDLAVPGTVFKFR